MYYLIHMSATINSITITNNYFKITLLVIVCYHNFLVILRILTSISSYIHFKILDFASLIYIFIKINCFYFLIISFLL